MSFITKRGLSIILIVLIVLTLSSIYILKSGSQKFVILDTNKVNSISDPALKIAIEATKECDNRLESEYKKYCYAQVAWNLGYYYGDAICEKLKKEFKLNCYSGYGRNLGEKYSPNITLLQDECSKTDSYEACLSFATIEIGKESSKHIETEQCQEFEQEDAKQRCYDGLGRQLARDNKEQSLCKKVKNEEACLLGFAYSTDIKGNRKEALQICDNLNDLNSKRCHYLIGISNTWAYNQTIDESFKNCDSEECKQGAAQGLAEKFFEEGQQKKDISILGTFAVYKTISPPATKVSLVITQQVIPHLRNYKLTYLMIIISSFQILITIRILKHRKFRDISKEAYKTSTQKTIRTTVQIQKILTQIIIQTRTIITQTIKKINKIIIQTIKKINKTIIQTRTIITQTIKKINKTIIIPASKFLIQKSLTLYDELKLILQDILKIDKTIIKLFFKELKTELRSKEGKKKLLALSLASITAILALAGNIHFEGNILGNSFVAATAGQSCNGSNVALGSNPTGTYCGGHSHGVAGDDLPVWNDCCDNSEVCCASNGSCFSTDLGDGTGACYKAAGPSPYDWDSIQGACIATWQCAAAGTLAKVCATQLYGSKTAYAWLTGPATDVCCGDDSGEDFASETDGSNFCCNAVSTADDSWCDGTWGWNIDGAQCQNDVEDTDGTWTPPTADNDIRCQCGSGSGNPCTTDYANTGVDGICATGAANDCYAGDVALVTATYYSCDGDGDGYRCDTNTAGGSFTQDSMCLSTLNNGGAWDCTTSGHACYDGTYYENSCASCSQTNGCESSITSGGDFSATGICITGFLCDETTHACFDDSNYQAACSSCALTSTADSGGDSCDTITDGSYAASGICTDTGTCTASGGTVRIDASASNTFIVNCDSSADACDTATASNLNTPFVADGICASNLCDSNEVCLDGVTYYSGCGTTCSYADQCDSDVGTSFVADGVCGVTGSTCCTDFGSDNLNDEGGPTTCNIESTVCGAGTNGYYCDDVDDANWGAGTTTSSNKYRCDASDTTCISCAANMTELLTAVDTDLNGDGKCESGCEAHTTCDEQESGAAINSTTFCSAFCGVDEIPTITSPKVVSTNAPSETSPSYHNETLNISYVITDINADPIFSWVTCFGGNETETSNPPALNITFGNTDSLKCTNSTPTSWNVETCEVFLTGSNFDIYSIATGNFTCKFYVDDRNVTVSSNEDTIMTDAAPVWFFEGLNITNLNEDTQIDVDPDNLDVGSTGNCTDIDSNESVGIVKFQLGPTSGGTWWINGSTTVPNTGANISYLPTANQSGTFLGIALVSCYTPGGLEASNITIGVTVDAVNDVPWWEANYTNSTFEITEEDGSQYITNMSEYFRDVPNEGYDKVPTFMNILTNESYVSCSIINGELSCNPVNNFTSWFVVNVTAYDDLVSNSITENFEINVSNVNDDPWWDPDLVQNQTTTEDSGASITYNLDEFSWDVEADINLINMTYGIDAVFGDNNASGTNCSINGAELYCINEAENRTGDNVLNITALDSNSAMTSIFMNISTLPVNDQPWWNETSNTTYLYLEDLPPTGLSYIIWDEAGLNNTYWDVENENENHLPYNCTVSANDTNIVTNVSYDDGSDGAVRANSVANASGVFILTTNCSDSEYLSETTSFEITIDPVNDEPTAPTITLNFTYDDTNYTNESMWCEVYIEDIDNTTGLSVDLIVMNFTDGDINNAVEQYFLPDAYLSQNNATYVSFEINETNFSKNSYVWCQAKINDQELNSSWVNSTSLKVENYPVQISSPLDNFTIDEDFTQDIYDGNNFTIYWGNNYTDADNNSYESDEVYINWTFEMNDTEILGIIMNNDTDTVSIGSLPNATGTVEINWTVIDSDNATYNETVYWTVNNTNDPPWTVLLNEPLNETNYSIMPEFNWANTTDIDPESPILNYTLQIDNNNDFSFPEYSNTSIQETDNTTEDVTVSLSDGHYYWRARAFDGEVYSDWSEVRYFTYDTQMPIITVSYPGNNSILYTRDDGTPGATLSINFTIDEQPDGMKNTISAAWWVNSSGDANSTEFVSVEDYDEDTRRYAINITDWGPDGQINVSVWANDSAGNEKALHYYTYSILTDSVPLVEWISLTVQDGNPILVSDQFDILVSVIPENDPEGNPVSINCTWLEVDYPNSTIDNLTLPDCMENSSVTEFYYNFTTDFPDGFYDLRVYSNYTHSGKEGTAGTVLRREVDNTPPNLTISDITVDSAAGITFYNESWSKYGDLEFHFAVSDNWTTKNEAGGDNHEIVNCSVIYFDEIGGAATYNITKPSPTKNIDQSIEATGINTLTDGVYNWTINCTDSVLNTGTDNNVKVIRVDITYPQLSFDTPSENQILSNVSNHPVINLTITDVISGVNHTWMEVNNSGGILSDLNNISLTESLIDNTVGTNATYAYDWNTLLYADDMYTITVYTNDSANNENVTVRTVKVDNSGPNITLHSPENNKIWASEDQNFQATVWDFSTIVNCSLIIDNAVNQTIPSGIQNNSIITFATSLTDGIYTWTINCTDEANNEETNSSAYTTTVDLTNPTITLTVPTDALEFYIDNASVNWSVIEPNPKINFTTILMNDSQPLMDTYYFNALEAYENLTLSAQDNLTNTLLGSYTVSVSVEDINGRIGLVRGSFIVNDSIAPNVILASPENGTIQNSSDITFSFNTSDYHSVDNCTLWLNQTEGYMNTTMTNDITVMQNINLTNITDEENVPWNITCYDNSTNNNNTELAFYIDIDTTPPLFSFIEPTDNNDTYVSRNSTYINVSITEPHNDTVTIVWNYTTNYTAGIEEVTVTPAEGNIIFYELNITNLTDGVYEYYIFANDTLANESEGHDNISEVRTITIDETPPSTFDLLDPSNNVELTDDTPAFNWEDSPDTNFDNYSLEVSTNAEFVPPIDKNFSSTTSYYALQESDALNDGIWYWRVIAADKANNQRNSTSTFQFTVGNVSLPTQYIMGTGGGGGGGGGKKIVYGVVSIIQPSMQTLYEEETIITSVIIQNTGEGAIKGIILKATTDSPAIGLDLSKAYIEYLAPGQEESVDLKIIARGVVGEYEVTVKVEATEPKITDQVKFYVNLIGFGLGKKTIIEEKLRFIGKLFESNPECLELREMAEEAKKELEEKDYDKSLEIIESAIKSCEELVKTSKKKVLEKPAEPKRTLQILIAEISAFILMFIMIYRYYRKRTYKGPVMTRKGKPGPTLVLLILIFLGGFFILKEYTGFTIFEDTSASDFNLGTHANTTTSGDNVILTSDSTLGNFTSRVFNANFTVEWQTINWSWASTANDNITIDVRTSFDNITWSSWSENVTNTSKIPNGKTVWTDEEDFIGTLTNTNITNQTGNITLNFFNDTDYLETGTFTSESLDLGFTGVNIATIEFTITNTSEEDNITIETSTSADNATWEGWAQTNVSGDQVWSTDNKYFKWKATLTTNDTTITPALEDLIVNYERNSTYLQYRATLSTNDPPKTPSLEWVNITYQDASYPTFEFLSPTANDTYTADNSTYLNFTITEPNNDSFYLDWNGTTTYYSTNMNETADFSEGVYSYGVNMTELVEGIYEYYIWANDTYGHENQTENFTVIVDQTLPTAFNLLNPSDGNRSTDNHPFLLWRDSNDTNFDNYTVQFSTDTDFGSITATYYNTSSNYQIQDSEALPSNGTFYWRAIAYDKAGQNYTTDYFTYYIGYEQITTIAPGTGGEGGGGGKRTERRQVGLELIKPSALSFFANREIIIPLLLSNTGTEILQGIELTAESPELELELKNNVFPVLRPNQEIDPQLVIKPVEEAGRYNIIVKAKVASPEFTDAIMFVVDVVEFGSGNKTEAEEKLAFVVDFIRSHEECAELEKFIIDAQEAFKRNEFDLVLSLTEQAMQSCKDLVSTAKEKKLEKKKRPTWQYYVPILEVLLFLLIFSSIYSYYKRLKFKRRKYW